MAVDKSRKTKLKLELGGNNDGAVRESRATVQAQERRKIPRLEVSREQFKLKDNGKLFSVIDVTEAGMALKLIDSKDLVLFTLGRTLQGQLNLRNAKIEIRGQVRYADTHRVGLAFADLSEESARQLAEQLDPTQLGKQLHLFPNSEPHCLWYHGPFGTELLVWRRAQEDAHRILCLVGDVYVQWSAENGLQAGGFKRNGDLVVAHGVVSSDTVVLTPDSVRDQWKLEVAKKVLLGCNLDQDFKDRLLTKLA